MRILFVCTGNICRSAVADRLTSAFAEAAGRGDLTSSSAGLAAVVGAPVHDRSAAALRELGGDPGGFRARQFVPAHADCADLVLTMTRSHRRRVLQLAPRALTRTFTLLEAAALLDGLGHQAELPGAQDLETRGRALVAALARQRAARTTSTGAGDVPDPVRGDARMHLEVADLIADALFPVLQKLVGVRVPAAS